MEPLPDTPQPTSPSIGHEPCALFLRNSLLNGSSPPSSARMNGTRWVVGAPTKATSRERSLATITGLCLNGRHRALQQTGDKDRAHPPYSPTWRAPKSSRRCRAAAHVRFHHQRCHSPAIEERLSVCARHSGRSELYLPTLLSSPQRRIQMTPLSRRKLLLG